MTSSVAKILLPGIGGKLFKDKKKAPAAPPATAPAPVAGPGPALDKATRKKEARRGLLGRGKEDREQVLGERGRLGPRAASLGVPAGAEIQGNRRFKRQGVRGASRRLLSR